MGFLAIFAVIYFLIQATIFWWLVNRNWGRGLKIAAALITISLLPLLMYLDGLHREFGDGGAANIVVMSLAFIGGFFTLIIVFVSHSIAQQSSVS
jgi:hypothetical protein